MKNSRAIPLITAFIACMAGSAVAQAAADDGVTYKPISISGQFDFGQVVKGQLDGAERLQAGEQLNGNFFQRTGVWITQEAIVNDRLSISVGVGGIFWYALPASSEPATKLTQFGPGISQAQGVYTFGNLDKPAARLQMGFFPYKYNSDAKNLGEYLLRSGTYPGYLVSGGWNMISSAAYMVQGLRLNVPLWDDKIQADLLLPMERDVPPLYALSPTLLVNAKPVSGVEVGAGVACNHCISTKPSLESPHIPTNAVIRGVEVDSSTPGSYSYTYIRDTTGNYYTFQGVKVMARASIDPKAFIPMPYLGSEDLKLYGEIAVLGWKNYAYLYDDRTKRMPVMVGLNLPAFRLLDVLSFELEYYNSQFPNSLSDPINNQTPTWAVITFADAEQRAAYERSIEQDNWKWSVYSKKTITKGIELYAQVASDHLRTFQFNGGPQPIAVPVTNRNGREWYYLVRLQFGI